MKRTPMNRLPSLRIIYDLGKLQKSTEKGNRQVFFFLPSAFATEAARRRAWSISEG